MERRGLSGLEWRRMANPLRFDLLHDDPDEARAAALAALDRGQLVLVPTETVYGLAAREDRPEALARLDAVKPGRDRPFSLAVPSLLVVADRLQPPSAVVGRITSRWWPGPVTLVLPRRGGGSLGLRVPGHAWTGRLVAEAGAPLCLPSANSPGASAPVSLEQVEADVLAAAAVVVDGGRAALGEASSVLRPGREALVILREGVVSRTDLARHAAPRVLVVCSGNTCRSPMGAALLTAAYAEAAQRRQDLVPARVASAGVMAGPGSPASSGARSALAARGLDLSDHASAPLAAVLDDSVDLILGMTSSHVALLSDYAAGSAVRVELFDPEGGEVEDPFGGSPAVYDRCAAALGSMARRRAAALASQGDTR